MATSLIAGASPRAWGCQVRGRGFCTAPHERRGRRRYHSSTQWDWRWLLPFKALGAFESEPAAGRIPRGTLLMTPRCPCPGQGASALTFDPDPRSGSIFLGGISISSLFRAPGSLIYRRDISTMFERYGTFFIYCYLAWRVFRGPTGLGPCMPFKGQRCTAQRALEAQRA